MLRVAVVGGGTMGVGIVHAFATSGALVWICDIDLDTARRGADEVRKVLDGGVERGKVDRTDADQALERVTACGALGEIPDGLDLLIESVPEDPDLKQAVLKEAETRNPYLLASNTSSISIDQLARDLDRPDRFLGLHFFNPVWANSLVEVVRGSETSEEMVGEALEAADFLNKEAIVVNDSPGFATSRLGLILGLEAIRMVQDGVAEPAAIDRAMELGYRHPMGPLRLGDLVGLDVRLAIAEHLASVYGERFEPPDLLRQMVAVGKLGKKTGQGFYEWDQ